MSEANKALCRRFVDEVWNNRNMSVIDEMFAANYVCHHPASQPDFGEGPQSVRSMINYYLNIFPDTRFTVNDLIAEGDKVVIRWTARGTHRGEFEGTRATGKQVTVTGTTTARFVNGKIVEEWENFDALEMLQQVGAVPKRATGRAGGA